MRVVVNIPPGSHPELLRELEQTPPRERAERLRMLATIGLLNMGQPKGLPQPSSTELSQPPSEETGQYRQPPEADPQTQRKQSLKSKLGLGL